MVPPLTDIIRGRLKTTPLGSRRFRLTVLTGRQAGVAKTLDGASEPLIIGSSPACSLHLLDSTVSRRHAVIEVRGDALDVTDAGSSNGTVLNGVRVFHAQVDRRATLELGATSLSIEVEEAAVPELPLATGFGKFFGVSVEVRRLYPLFERLAKATIPTLIEGETGTGKEVLAEALHEQGLRKSGPFVVMDCTTIPAGLAESELFGSQRGAFTGASDREGLAEQAEGGTLFIDEIGDLELPVQARLLRLVDRQEVRPVGSTRTRRIDCRIIAATRRTLEVEVEAGRFRDDLFHRLAVGRVTLPPLRARRGDVPVLARRLLEQLGVPVREVPREVLEMWEASTWPGNVRELKHAIERYAALGEAKPPTLRPRRAELEDMSDPVSQVIAMRLSLPDARRALMDEFERRYVAAALERTEGNVSEAARTSGVARRHFQTLKARAPVKKKN